MRYDERVSELLREFFAEFLGSVRHGIAGRPDLSQVAFLEWEAGLAADVGVTGYVRKSLD